MGIIKSKKERTITEGDSGRDQEGQAHGGTILSMAQWSKKNGKRILECLNLAILVNTRFPVDALSDLLRFVQFLFSVQSNMYPENQSNMYPENLNPTL